MIAFESSSGSESQSPNGFVRSNSLLSQIQPEDEEKALLVILINLERSTDRRLKMEGQLNALGIKFERFEAIDGRTSWKEISRSVNIREFQKNVGRDILKGEVGCYLSHIEAWKTLLQRKNELLLVLEDDVVFGEDFIYALNLAIRNKNIWDILKLNKIRAKQPVRQVAIEGYSLNSYIGAFTGMGAYLIRRSVVERIFPLMLPITRPIDHELELIHKYDIRHFGIEPFPSWVDDGGKSTITGTDFNGVRKYRWYLRAPVYYSKMANIINRLVYLSKNKRLKIF